MSCMITPSLSQIKMANVSSPSQDDEYLLRRSPSKPELRTVPTSVTQEKGASPTTGIKRFAGKVAIVTESTEGIGFSIAKQLVSEGAYVVVSSKQGNIREAVDKLKANNNIVARGFACDVSNSQQVKNLIGYTFKEFGKIDVILFNIAFPDMPLDINLKYSTAFLKEAEGKLQFGSSFVFIAATKTNVPDVSRAMIRHIKPIANEMFSKDIRVKCVASISELDIPADKIREQEKANIAHNAVAAAIWLASDAAAGITGTGVTLMAAGEIPSNL